MQRTPLVCFWILRVRSPSRSRNTAAGVVVVLSVEEYERLIGHRFKAPGKKIIAARKKG